MCQYSLSKVGEPVGGLRVQNVGSDQSPSVPMVVAPMDRCYTVLLMSMMRLCEIAAAMRWWDAAGKERQLQRHTTKHPDSPTIPVATRDTGLLRCGDSTNLYCDKLGATSARWCLNTI